MRKSLVTAAAVAAGALTALPVVPAHAAEYSSALKIRGVQYDAPGRDSSGCSSGNTDQEYLTVKKYFSRTTINLKGYVVKDATGNRFTFTANHYLQPGEHVKLRGGHGTDPDTPHNIVYRQLQLPAEQREGHHLLLQAHKKPRRHSHLHQVQQRP